MEQMEQQGACAGDYPRTRPLLQCVKKPRPQAPVLPQLRPQEQPQVPFPVDASQQGLQQALATKSGNTIPWVVVYRPQVLQELQELQLHAMEVPPVQNNLEAVLPASRSSYAGVSNPVTASRPAP